MLVMFILAVVAIVLIYGAVRILAGWTLPSATVQRLDRGVDAAATGSLKAIVVVVGLGLLILIVAAALN